MPAISKMTQRTNKMIINNTGEKPFFNTFVQLKNKHNDINPGNTISKSDWMFTTRIETNLWTKIPTTNIPNILAASVTFFKNVSDKSVINFIPFHEFGQGVFSGWYIKIL